MSDMLCPVTRVSTAIELSPSPCVRDAEYSPADLSSGCWMQEMKQAEATTSDDAVLQLGHVVIFLQYYCSVSSPLPRH